MEKIVGMLTVLFGPSWRTSIVAYLGAALADYAVQIDAIPVQPKYKPWAHLVALLIAAFGRAAKDGAVSGTEAAIKAKRRVARAAKPLAVVALLLLTPVVAQASAPLVVCLKGCPTEKLKAGPDTQISDVLWFGPSVGAFFVRDGATRSWEGNVQPALAYGLKFKPAWWTATASLVAIDLSLSAKFDSALTPKSIDLLPMVTFANAFGIGVGPRFHLASTPAERDAVSFLLGLSINTALGMP
jgi:hypothetical protein